MQLALVALVIAAQVLPIISTPIHTVLDIVETTTVDVYVTIGPGAPAPANIQQATTTAVAAPHQQNGRPQWQGKEAQGGWQKVDTSSAAPPAPKVVTSVVAPAPVSSPKVAIAKVQQQAPTVTTQTTPAPAPTTQASPSSAPSSSSSSSGNTCNEDCTAALSAHNTYRKCHQITDDMQWNTTLVDSATQWANTCAMAHPLGPLGYGQNIGMGTNIAASIDAWYNKEMPLFTDYNVTTPSGMGPGETAWETWGHYTQVVWKGSTQIGCATAQCPSTKYGSFTVCNYEEPGNMMGAFDKNVFANTC